MLGPILFIMYINYLRSLNIVGNIVSFADDFALISEGKTWGEIFDICDTDLTVVNSWLNNGILTIMFDDKNNHRVIRMP